VLLKESVLAVHVGAEEQSVPVDDVVPESLVDVRCIIIFVIFYVVLMRWDIFPDYSWCWLVLLLRIFIFLACCSVLFLAFSATITFIESLLKPSKLIIKIYKDIRT
jgi:hypothetical protein